MISQDVDSASAALKNKGTGKKEDASTNDFYPRLNFTNESQKKLF